MSPARLQPLPRPLRSVDVSVRTETWPRGKIPPPGLSALAGTQQVDIADVLREVALRTSPPISLGFSLADCWAWLRYAPALDMGPGLRLRSEWRDLDPHQKTIFSDDWGVGLSMHLLDDALNLANATSTSYFLSQTQNAWLMRSGRRGPSKSPDFIAQDMTGAVHIIECKGSQSNPATLEKQIEAGRAQKQNIRFSSAISVGERLVVASFIPQSHSVFDALVVIEDPPEDEEEPVLDMSPEEVEEIIVRGELASTLRVARLPKLASLVAMNERGTARNDNDVARELTLLSDSKTAGRWAKTWKAFEQFAYQVDGSLRSKAVDVEVSLSMDAIDAALDPDARLANRFPRTKRTRRADEHGRTVARTSLGLEFAIGVVD